MVMHIALQYVKRAELPHGVVLEQPEPGWFLLRCGDYVFDWGVYNWGDRYIYDSPRHRMTPEQRHKETHWFKGRYLVPAEKIIKDTDPGADHPAAGAVCLYPDPPTCSPPSWWGKV
jgi:hypothetical protein